MPTLLLRLKGPMQSWGTTSRFDQRDTGKEPSKSGIIGLLAAAMGINRTNWDDLKLLTKLKMGVRHDRPGVLRKDYQTAGCSAPNSIIKADGTLSKNGVVSDRFYLADAAFLVGLEGDNRAYLESLQNALLNPRWVLGLGRKSYLSSDPIYIKNGISESSLKEALCTYPWLCEGKIPEKILYSFEAPDSTGRMVMDQPLSSFSDRQFGARFVITEWLAFAQEEKNVST